MWRSMKLLVSVHDVAPAHAERLVKAEQLLDALGVPRVTYLLVPNYHGRGDAHEDDEFVAWCRQARPFDVQWFLHGCTHLEDRSRVERSDDARSWFARRFMTAGEGEFLSLRGEALRQRLRAGVDGFTRCLGFAPPGFVAPAWLFNRELLPALAAEGFRFSEDHFRVFDVQGRRCVESPVVTWATRTFLRRQGSRCASPLLARWWARREVLRIALHPTDFDHPYTVVSICRALDLARGKREIASYSEDLFAAASRSVG